MAYQFGNPNRAPIADEYSKVKSENDWTAAQVARYPGRLIAFCGVDPLRDYALAEIDRCSRNGYLRTGLKLHFGNSDVDLDNPEHVRALQKVFAAADRHGMAVTVHLHANIDHRRPYGTREANLFLTQILPYAPHVMVQIAHLAGGGDFDDPGADEALSVFANALAAHDERMSHVYFDIAVSNWQSRKDLIAARLRQIGIERILFGCDGAWTDFKPVTCLAAYRQLPLTPEEFRTIDRNTPPYLALSPA